MSQESGFIWSGHLQFQITSNCYQAKVNVLSVDKEGKGTVFTFLPDERLQHASLLPRSRSDGKSIDVPDVWLLYSNGNHYDALIKEDNPLLTMGPIQKTPVWHLDNDKKFKETPSYFY